MKRITALLVAMLLLLGNISAIGYANPEDSLTDYDDFQSQVGIVGDKEALQARYNALSGTLYDNDTTETWDAFQNALTAAKAILDNTAAIQTEVDDALAALNTAFDGLTAAVVWAVCEVRPIASPVAGHFPASLFKYPYKANLYNNTSTSATVGNGFNQTLTWEPAIDKAFLPNTEYTVTLTLEPNAGWSNCGMPGGTAVSARSFSEQGITPDQIAGLPTEGVKAIHWEYAGTYTSGSTTNQNANLIIHITFDATGSTNEAPDVIFYEGFSKGVHEDKTIGEGYFMMAQQANRAGLGNWRDNMTSVRQRTDGGSELVLAYQKAPEMAPANASAYVKHNFITASGVRTRGRTTAQGGGGYGLDDIIYENAFGYYEANIKFPQANVVWGAFWLFSPATAAPLTIAEGGSIYATEIDIIESAGFLTQFYNAAYHVYRNSADRNATTGPRRGPSPNRVLLYPGDPGWETASRMAASEEVSIHTDARRTGINIYDGQFHKIGLEWSPTDYIFTVDGVVIGSWKDLSSHYRSNGGNYSDWPWINQNEGVMQNPAYIKLTVEAAEWADTSNGGANWGNSPDNPWAPDRRLGISPDYGEMIVDYVYVLNGPKPTGTIDKTSFQARYNELKDTVNDDYTQSSWDAFQNALKSAKIVLDHPFATYDELNSAIAALNLAFDGLQKEAVSPYAEIWSLILPQPTSTLDNERIVKAKYLLYRGGYGRVGNAQYPARDGMNASSTQINLPYGIFVPTGVYATDSEVLAIRDALFEAEARLWAYNLMELYSGDPLAPIGRRQSGLLNGFNTRYGRINSAMNRPDLQQLPIVVEARALYTTMNNYRTAAGYAATDTNERNAGGPVVTLINHMNWDDPASIAAARTAYDALAPRGKAAVSNYDMLKKAEGIYGQIPSNIKSVGGRSPSNGNGYTIAQWQNQVNSMKEMIPETYAEHIWITGMLGDYNYASGLGGITVNIDFNSIATDGKYAPPGYTPLTLAEWREKHINFAMAGTGRPTHEEFLTQFDQDGTKVWLQVENGFADMITLIDIYKDLFNIDKHPSVIGFAIDVEWYAGLQDDMGIPVTDATCKLWNEHLYQSWGPGYQMLLKHFSVSYLPFTYRGGEAGKSEKVVFCNDSQGSTLATSYMQNFQEFAAMYPDNKIVDQIGYAPDRAWFFAFNDPVVKSKSVMLGESAVANPTQEKGIVWVQGTFNDPLTFRLGTDAQAAAAVNAALNYLLSDNLASWNTNSTPGYRLRRTLAGETTSIATVSDALFVAAMRRSVESLPNGENNTDANQAQWIPRIECLKEFEAIAVDTRVKALPATMNLALRRDGDTVYAIWDTYQNLTEAQKAEVKEYPALAAAKARIDQLKAVPITSIKIESLSITTVARGGVYTFSLTLNEGALGDHVEWTISNPSLGYVDKDGTVTIFDKIGNVRLTATDPVSKLSHSITLRIAS